MNDLKKTAPNSDGLQPMTDTNELIQ